jgi:hypothetical protein
MAYVEGEAEKTKIICPQCKKTIVCNRYDLRHYRHDVEGTNVFVYCPSCGKDMPCYHEAVNAGWIEPEGF